MRVGEFAAQAGLGAKTVRFYEQLGLIHPDGRTPAGYRIYLPDQVEPLRFIRAARMLGLSLREVAEMLDVWDCGRRPCDDVMRHIARKIQEVDRQIEGLHQLKRQLQELYTATQALSPNASATSDRQARCICAVVADMASTAATVQATGKATGGGTA